MPEIFQWKPIGRYVSGSPLLDITAYFRANLRGVWNIRGQEDTRSVLEDSRLIFGRFAVNIFGTASTTAS